MPHLFVVNKMDRPGADFTGTLAALQSAYGRHVVAEQLPLGSAESFHGFVDLAELRARGHKGDVETDEAIPGDAQDNVARPRGELLEAMADFDDHLMEELLEGIEPPLDEIERDLCTECAHDQIVPVLVASGVSGAGVPALVARWKSGFRRRAESPKVDAEGRPIAPDANGPVIAHVIKTVDPSAIRQTSIVRTLSGTLKSDATLVNISKGDEKVRSGGLYRLQGKKQEAITEAGPGSIVAIGRLETVATGDVLTSNGHKILLERPPSSEPVFAVAIRPKDRIDEAKISQMLVRIVDEDPSLRVRRADITNELLLLGCGEQHASIAIERLARKYKVEVEMHPPSIPYIETITTGTEIHSRYKHQTGGHGQFGDVWLRFEPRPRGSGVTFEEKIVGGVVPRQFFPAVEKGVREALLHGPSGHPVTDVHVTLYDGAYHDVDSSEQSFKTAAGMGVREALPKCNPVGARTDRPRVGPGSDHLHVDGHPTAHRQARPDSRHESRREARLRRRRSLRPASRAGALYHRTADRNAGPRHLLVAPRTLRSGPRQPRRPQSGGLALTNRRRILVKRILALAALAASLAACTKVSNEDQGAGRHSWTQAGVLRIAIQGDVKNLNPLLNSNTTDVFINRLMFEPLLTADPKGNPLPMLASIVPTTTNGGISADGLTITYHLRKDAKWTDGVAVTSNDVKWSWSAIMNPANNVVSRHGYDYVKSVDTPDDATVVVHLKQKFSPFVNSFFAESDQPYPIAPEHILAKYANLNTIQFNGEPNVSDGPFRFAEWSRNDHINLVRNDNFFLGKPNLDRIEIKVSRTRTRR